MNVLAIVVELLSPSQTKHELHLHYIKLIIITYYFIILYYITFYIYFNTYLHFI